MHEHLDIPIHSFTKDDASSIPFEMVPLTQRTGYDSSVPHRHNYYEIFMFTKGGGVHQVDFKECEIADYSIHFISPGQVHHVQRDNDSHGFVILFSRDFFHVAPGNRKTLLGMPFLHNRTPDPLINLTAEAFEGLFNLVTLIQKEYNTDKEGKEEIIRSYLNILLLESKRFYDERHPDDESGASSNLYQQFHLLLEERFAELHQVNEYASELGVTEKQLNETTRTARGRTCLELIHQRIMLEARRLLVHSEYSIKEIAYYLHFEDPSHFGKFFKKRSGETPAVYRKAHQS